MAEVLEGLEVVLRQQEQAEQLRRDSRVEIEEQMLLLDLVAVVWVLLDWI